MKLNTREKILKLSKKFEKEIISLRREIHKYPELAFEEFRTSALIYNKLKKLKPDSLQKMSVTGVVALLGNKKGKCAGLRADIDALPIHEKTGLPFASKNPGKMHACGHDTHTAMLYGAALILNSMRDEINGRVKLIFQPAEEKNPGGASIMIKDGVLENPKVDAIFGQHVIVDEPAGNLGFYPGVMMASQDELYITIYGKQAHGAKPHMAIDPIVIASQAILAIQTIVSRNSSPYDPLVITIGKIEGGTATNIIPSEVRLAGTIRTLNEKLRKKCLKIIDRTLKGITQSAGAKYKFEISPGYPELINDKEHTEFAEKAAIEFTGKKNVFEAEKLMGAEDFAYYLKKVPGTFYRIGVGNTTDIHTPTINIDEKTLHHGAGFLAYLAIKYLNEYR